MLLTAVCSSLLIAALVRTGSAAAINSDLRNRAAANWVPGWANGAVTNGVNTLNGAIQGVPGAVGRVVGGAENIATGLIPGGLIPNSQNCPKIIQMTDWDKQLGVAPVAKAINKDCPWKGTMADVWGVVRCGGNCLLAFVQEDLNALQDSHCVKCIGQHVIDNIPCINASGGFQNICTKATAIPGIGPCLTGTVDTPGICPKQPANRRILGTS